MTSDGLINRSPKNQNPKKHNPFVFFPKNTSLGCVFRVRILKIKRLLGKNECGTATKKVVFETLAAFFHDRFNAPKKL